jgi:hypothetical protein
MWAGAAACGGDGGAAACGEATAAEAKTCSAEEARPHLDGETTRRPHGSAAPVAPAPAGLAGASAGARPPGTVIRARRPTPRAGCAAGADAGSGGEGGTGEGDKGGEGGEGEVAVRTSVRAAVGGMKGGGGACARAVMRHSGDAVAELRIDASGLALAPASDGRSCRRRSSCSSGDLPARAALGG